MLLADIVAQPLLDVEAALHVSLTAGWTLTRDSSKGEIVKFSHDRYRVRPTIPESRFIHSQLRAPLSA